MNTTANEIVEKFTPGPWQVTTSMSGARSVSQTADLYSVALIEKWRPEYEANAKLIAAAPEMYEALNKTFESLRGLTVPHNAKIKIEVTPEFVQKVHKLLAAINK